MSSSSVQVTRPPSSAGTGKDVANTSAPGTMSFDVRTTLRFILAFLGPFTNREFPTDYKMFQVSEEPEY